MKLLGILEVNKTEQHETIEELFERSKPGSVYYGFLFFSSIIIACGILLESPTIVIGGMLVTPILTPILVVSLCLAVGELRPLRSVGVLILKSSLIVIAVSSLLALLFEPPSRLLFFGDSLRDAVLYFVVAFIAGIAATFAWVRRETADALPGIAIAVSLVPPLSVFGISVTMLDPHFARISFLVFLFNLLGIILGSTVVFSLLKFQSADKDVKKEAAAAEKAAAAEAAARQAEAKKEK